ncbi:ABC transporter substrate-binding protein [Paenibacillus turpanensis]|uniref:ABC transporter substrate-binding protein n=1 Tax=Paenibacillus turpanensis TaxID=2689078 RepID=UPI00140895AC|nr:ABC transporter substrate-binding protein [Paenibacillus turpanensis]
MRMKKWMTLSLASAMLITAIGCSSSNGTKGSTEQNNGESDSKEKVTYTYFNAAAAAKDINTNETTIGKILEEQTGVNFKIEHLVGDLETKIGTMIASNEYPDVLIPDKGIDKIIDAGAFIPLNELIEKHGPNIKKVYGPYMDQMKWPDGNIYFLPFSNVVGEFIPDPSINQGAFWVQRRVLEEAGYPKIKKLDDYFTLIEDYKNKHKDEDLTGFIALTHDWRFFALANPPMHLEGYPNEGNVIVDMKTFEAKTYATADSTKRWLQKLNEINAKGLFDKSSFVDNFDQYLAKLTSGKVLGYFDYGWQTQNATNVLKDAAKADPSKDKFRYFPLPVTFDGQKDQYLDPPGFVTNRGIGITVSAENPERIVQYFDNLLKPENQILRSWGIKGETYEVNEQGRFYRTAEQVKKINETFNETFGFKYYSWNWPNWGNGSSLPDGNAIQPGIQPEVFQMDLTEGDKKIMEKYGVQTYSELFSKPDPRPWFPAWAFPKEQGSPQQIWETKKDDITKKYYPKLVLSSPGDFDKVWAEYTAEMGKLDTAQYEKWTTEQIQSVMKQKK